MRFIRLIIFCLCTQWYMQLCTQEKPLVVVIPSYNNTVLFDGVERYKRNLDSVFFQKYDNYRVVYIDDYSPDGTADYVQEYIKECGQEERVTLVKNKKRWGPSRNRYCGVHLCDDEEIVLFLDGDDWFPHNKVLKKINKAYEDPDVWVTYSQFRTVPNNTLSGGQATPDWVVKQCAYRQYGWYYHSLKTFYAGLFKRIKLKDLLYKGDFFQTSSDIAEMFPVMEMSGGRFKFIPEILYLASQHSNNEMHTQGKEMMQCLSQHIFNMQPYAPVNSIVRADKDFGDNQLSDVMIFSSNVHQLSMILEGIENHVVGVGSISVVWEKENNYLSDYKKVQSQFPLVRFHALNAKELEGISDIVSDLCHEHCLLLTDQHMIREKIDLSCTIKLLENTDAYTFFCIKDPALKKDIKVKNFSYWHIGGDNVYGWQFKARNKKHRVHGMLYRKHDIQELVCGIHSHSLHNFLDILSCQHVDQDDIGLFFN